MPKIFIGEKGDKDIGDGFGDHESAKRGDGGGVEDDGEVEGKGEEDADGDVAEKGVFGFVSAIKIEKDDAGPLNEERNVANEIDGGFAAGDGPCVAGEGHDDDANEAGCEEEEGEQIGRFVEAELPNDDKDDVEKSDGVGSDEHAQPHEAEMNAKKLDGKLQATKGIGDDPKADMGGVSDGEEEEGKGEELGNHFVFGLDGVEVLVHFDDDGPDDDDIGDVEK